MLQPEGVGETLAVAIANKKDAEEEEVVWILDDSYNKKDIWTQATVEVRATEPTQDFEYRVIKQLLTINQASFAHWSNPDVFCQKV